MQARVKRGMLWGLGLGIAFSLLDAAGLRRNEHHIDVPLEIAVGLYLVGGVVGGAIHGHIEHQARNRRTAWLVWLATFAPFVAGYAAYGILVGSFSTSQIVAPFIWAIGVGGIAAVAEFA